MSQNPLDEVIAVLIAGNINQGDTRSVNSTFADTIEITGKELGSSNLQALLNYLGGVLVEAVFGCVSNDMVYGTTLVCRLTMFTDVLDAPISELPFGDEINVGEDFLDTRSL